MTMRTETVLVCDPDPRIQRALRVILRGAGYDVLTCGTGEDALRYAADHPQAVIFELSLPDIGGIELCRRLRQRGTMPILVLSTIDEEATKIEALESGSDDYITKPFMPGELVARLATRLRAAPSGLLLDFDGLVIDLAGHQVSIDGTNVLLTPTEFALLRVLATRGGAVSHQELVKRVWGRLDGDPALRLRRHIANLRLKMHAGRYPNVIRTHVGYGYRFDPSTPGDASASEAEPTASL
jgi:two-component system, OmpR family, KDP operon response regulator KdpE